MDSLRDYYKKQYEIESARRQALNAAVAFPLGLISLVIGGLTLVAKGVPWPLTDAALLQVGCVTVSGIFVLASAYLAAKSFYGYAYGHVPTSAEIKTYYERVAQYYEAELTSAEAKTTAESEALEYLDSETAKCADINSRNNDRKSYFLHLSNGAVLLAVASLAVASGPYIVDSMFNPTPPQKIEIANLKEAVMQLQRNANQSNDQKPVQPPAQTPTTTEKPSPPPSRLIKEHNDPTKQRK
jgi:hypothetical protein